MFWVSAAIWLSRSLWSLAAAVAPAATAFVLKGCTVVCAVSGVVVVVVLGRMTIAPTEPPRSAATSASGRTLFVVVVIGLCLLVSSIK